MICLAIIVVAVVGEPNWAVFDGYAGQATTTTTTRVVVGSIPAGVTDSYDESSYYDIFTLTATTTTTSTAVTTVTSPPTTLSPSQGPGGKEKNGSGRCKCGDHNSNRI